MYNSRIAGMGAYVPENVVTNDDLSKMMDTNDAWIQERTGIQERRHIKDGDGNTTAVMGVKAAKIALDRAKMTAQDIDMIVFATLSPDYYFPGCGVQVQEMLEMRTVPALDVRNQCSGFVYALSTADQFIKTGMYKNILVIGSENHSGGLDMTTRGRSVSVIFGDGAGAAVLTREEDNDPEDTSYFPYMNGQFVFKNAVVRFAEVIQEGLAQNKLTAADIDMLIPHQANLRISQFVQKQFKLNDDKVYNNIQKYGNTTAASIPIALTEAWEEGKIKEGDTVVLAAFGSGFTWASAIIKW